MKGPLVLCVKKVTKYIFGLEDSQKTISLLGTTEEDYIFSEAYF